MHQMLYQLGRNAHSTVLVIEFVIDMSRLREEAVEHGIRLVMNDATIITRRQAWFVKLIRNTLSGALTCCSSYYS